MADWPPWIEAANPRDARNPRVLEDMMNRLAMEKMYGSNLIKHLCRDLGMHAHLLVSICIRIHELFSPDLRRVSRRASKEIGKKDRPTSDLHLDHRAVSRGMGMQPRSTAECTVLV